MWNRCAAALVALGAMSIAGAQESADTAAPPRTYLLSVALERGQLSIRMQNAPIRAALEELGRRTGVRITVAQEIDDAEISAEFSGPLDAGLRGLTGMYDAFFYYGGAGADPSDLRAVWVFPKGAALKVQPVPFEACAAGKELEADSTEPDAHVRQEAYETLMTRPDSHSREVVIQAIRGVREKDADLRQRIFSAALSKGLNIPPELLADLARADGSEQIRWMALDALSQQGMARQAAEAALTDASPAVRQKAEEILTALAAEGHRRDGTPRPPEEQR